jgi:hypothetical protein
MASHILDRKVLIPNQNVMLLLPSLVSFICGNFFCKSCGKSNPGEMEFELVGLASSLIFCCIGVLSICTSQSKAWISGQCGGKSGC